MQKLQCFTMMPLTAKPTIRFGPSTDPYEIEVRYMEPVRSIPSENLLIEDPPKQKSKSKRPRKSREHRSSVDYQRKYKQREKSLIFLYKTHGADWDTISTLYGLSASYCRELILKYIEEGKIS
jgi:hypothetical protein